MLCVCAMHFVLQTCMRFSDILRVNILFIECVSEQDSGGLWQGPAEPNAVVNTVMNLRIIAGNVTIRVTKTLNKNLPEDVGVGLRIVLKRVAEKLSVVQYNEWRVALVNKEMIIFLP